MIVSDTRAFQIMSKMQIFDHPSSNFNLRVRRIFQHVPHDLTYNKLKQTQLIISKCSNLICCKRQVQSRFDVFLVDLSPFVAHKAEVCFCLHKVNVWCSSLTVNLLLVAYQESDHLTAHLNITASKSKTAESFVDSCLLCTVPAQFKCTRKIFTRRTN